MTLTASILTLCMASTAWHEARGEGIEGMTAVMEVVQHRAQANFRGASDQCEVAKSSKQFSAFNAGYSEPEFDQSFLDVLPLAWKVYKGKIDNLPSNVMHYHTAEVNPRWADSSKVYAVIQNHIFYEGIR